MRQGVQAGGRAPHVLAVIAREGGRSSTPRPLGLSTSASGILGHPPSRVTTIECVARRALYNIPDSSSSAFSINSSLTITVWRGTRKIIVEAQAIDRTKIAVVNGSVVVEWPPR